MDSDSRVFVLSGENGFLLRNEKLHWIREFTYKFGADAVVRISAEALSIRDLMDEVTTLPFLAEKRLVVVEGIPRCDKEEIRVLCAGVHPNVFLLFVEGKPDKRFTGTKELLAMADVKNYAPLKGKSFERWMQVTADTLSSSLSPQATKLLLEYVGEQQELMQRELEKLSLYAHGRRIEEKDVEMLAVPSYEGVLWKLTDFLVAGRKAEATRYAMRMLDRGADAYGLWSMLLSIIRSVVLLRAAQDSRISSLKDIAEATGLHPFAVRSQGSYAKRIPLHDIQRLVAWSSDADIQLKTGSLRSSDEAPQELHALIDALLLEVP